MVQVIRVHVIRVEGLGHIQIYLTLKLVVRVEGLGFRF
jgi:hypothetical protein